ncbi:cobalt-precorrin-2 C(20)-methyltransferase [Halalkalicoccus paucihalophilus]|uniref:Cobalt-precorrin-2 C(20)-methyltransferase n=1 Tax=Halalkalicoccus paucihalophilus TaxID=1008153 RepID=A0A151A8J3_9EURY|nr:cobalt-precorrin-2 C(20)-methyltransferase [Halalkalicoccus paucihalophilus]
MRGDRRCSTYRSESVDLFKVTDAPTTHEKLTAAGYEVTFGRRLFRDTEETLVTNDPGDVTGQDYYTLAYAEKQESTGSK